MGLRPRVIYADTVTPILVKAIYLTDKFSCTGCILDRAAGINATRSMANLSLLKLQRRAMTHPW